MKTRLIGFALIAKTQLVCAQTQKGNGLISGTAGVSYNRGSSDFSDAQYGWQPTLNLTAGRFVADNWLAGLSVSGDLRIGQSNAFIFNGQTAIPKGNKTTDLSVTTTPFVRRYVAVGPAHAFVGAGLAIGVNGYRQSGYGFTGTSNGLIDTRATGWSVNPYLEAGVNYFVSNRLAIQLKTSASSVPVNVGSLELGLVYWTGPNQKSGPMTSQENPQTNAKNWLVEGDFSASGTRSADLTNSSGQAMYRLAPSVGYFVSKNSLLGVSIPLTYDRFGPGNTSGWSVGISPYYQYYWLATRLTPYARASVTYGLRTIESIGDNKIETLGADISLGLAYMAGKRFIIETGLASVSLNRTQYDLNRNTHGVGVSSLNQWTTRLSAGLRGNFAVRYVLTRPR